MSLFSDAALKLWVELGIKDPQNVVKQIESIGKQAEVANKKMDNFAAGAKVAGIALGAMATAATTAFIVAMKKTIDYGQSLATMSAQTDISVTKLQRLKYAAEQMNTEFASITTAVKGLTTRLAGLDEGAAAPTRAFKKLGIELTDASGKMKKMDELFPEMLLKLADLEEGTEKNILGQQLLGKAWTNIKPMVSNRQELEKNLNALKDYQLMSEETAKAIDEYNNAIARMKAAYQGIWNQAVTQIIPMLNDLVNWMNENADTITNVLLIAIGALKGSLEGLIGIFGDVINSLKDLGISFDTTEKGMVDLQSVSDLVSYNIYRVWNILKLGFVTIVDTVIFALDILVTAFISVVKVFSAVGSFLQGIFSGIIQGIGTMASRGLDFLINMVESANKILSKFGMGISTQGLWGAKASVDALRGSMMALGEESKGFSGLGSSLAGDWQGVFKNAYSATKQTGKNIWTFDQWKSNRDFYKQFKGSSSSAGGGDTLLDDSGLGGGGGSASDKQNKTKDDLIKRIDDIANKIKLAVKGIYDYQLNVVQNTYDNMMAYITKEMNDEVWLTNTMHEAKLKALDDELEKIKSQADYKKSLAQEEYNQKIEALEKEKALIKERYDYGNDQADIELDKQLAAIDDKTRIANEALDREIRAIDVRYDREIDRLDLVSRKRNDSYDDQIRAIDELSNSEDEAERKAERQERLAVLQNDLSLATTPEEALRIQKEIDKELRDQKKEETRKQREDKKEALRLEQELQNQADEENKKNLALKAEQDKVISQDQQKMNENLALGEALFAKSQNKATKEQLKFLEDNELKANETAQKQAKDTYEFKKLEADQWEKDETERINRLKDEETARYNNDIFYIEQRYNKAKEFLDKELADKKEYFEELNNDTNLNEYAKKLILAGEAIRFIEGNAGFIPKNPEGKSVGEMIVESGSVPKFGMGGIVNRPTLAVVGERGPEMIVPLNKIQQNIGQNVSGFVNLLAGMGSSMYDYTEAGGGGSYGSNYGYGGGSGGSGFMDLGYSPGHTGDPAIEAMRNAAVSADRASMIRRKTESSMYESANSYRRTHGGSLEGWSNDWSPTSYNAGANFSESELNSRYGEYSNGGAEENVNYREYNTGSPRQYTVNITNNSPEPLDAQQINDSFKATMAVMGLNA
jgi:hypothetical protein